MLAIFCWDDYGSLIKSLYMTEERTLMSLEKFTLSLLKENEEVDNIQQNV